VHGVIIATRNLVPDGFESIRGIWTEMVKKVAPSKLTGGGGFVFEDKVAAYFLSCLLSGQPPFDPNLGILTRIDFQTRVDGWFLDDLLLTVESKAF
jgi:hypothetical protein